MGVTSGGPGGRATGRLRIIYRSHGGENLKSRPPYYSKLLGLVSAIRAARESGHDPHLVFWNDGPVPGDRLALMRSCGEVAQIEGGSNRASYRAALELAAASDWPDADVVWFAEDDYLYRPASFRWVMEGAAAIWAADYLSIFGGKALDPASPRTATAGFARRGAADSPAKVVVGDVTWFPGVSTTSTFGVRLGVLREDRALLRVLPFSGGAWDHTTCLAVQGRQPFSWQEIRGEVLPFGSLPVGQWPASVARGAVRAAVNLRSRRAEDHRRRLYLADPVGAQHMELPIGGRGVDWAGLAGETRAWAAAAGIELARRSDAWDDDENSERHCG